MASSCAYRNGQSGKSHCEIMVSGSYATFKSFVWPVSTLFQKERKKEHEKWNWSILFSDKIIFFPGLYTIMNQILNQILNWISFTFYTVSQHFGKRGLTVFWSHHSTSVLNKLHRSICLFSFSYLVHGFGWPGGCLSCPRVRGGTEASGKLYTERRIQS